MSISPRLIDKGIYWERAWQINQGCTPVSEACLRCWSAAGAYMRQFQKNPKIADRYKGLTHKVNGIPTFNGTVRLCHDNLDLPLRVKKPTVFSIWNDLFHEAVPFKFIRSVYGTTTRCPKHTILALTKRIGRAKEFYVKEKSGSPKIHWGSLSNLWLGVTCENQKCADKRIPILLQIPTAHRFVSFEPLLESIEISADPQWYKDPEFDGSRRPQYGFDLAIVGAETGHHARYCPIENIENIVEQCKAAGVPVFVKAVHLVTGGGTSTNSNLKPCEGKVWWKFKISKNMSEWPESVRVRELPF